MTTIFTIGKAPEVESMVGGVEDSNKNIAWVEGYFWTDLDEAQDICDFLNEDYIFDSPYSVFQLVGTFEKVVK